MSDGHKPHCRRNPAHPAYSLSETCSCGWRPDWDRRRARKTAQVMPLLELRPEWLGDADEDGARPVATFEEAQGVIFVCPVSTCHHSIPLYFENPVSRPPAGPGVYPSARYRREGDSFENLTLRPEVVLRGGCNWAGKVEAGRVVTIAIP